MPYVLIVHEVADYPAWKRVFDGARRFFESPRLAQIRDAAGVRAPEFLYLEPLDAGVL